MQKKKPINCTGMMLEAYAKYYLASAGWRVKEKRQQLLGTRPRNEGTVADVGQVTSVTAPAATWRGPRPANGHPGV